MCPQNLSSLRPYHVYTLVEERLQEILKHFRSMLLKVRCILRCVELSQIES